MKLSQQEFVFVTFMKTDIIVQFTVNFDSFHLKVVNVHLLLKMSDCEISKPQGGVKCECHIVTIP